MKTIERRAKKAGISINIAPANSWIGSKGKGKWAYSIFVPGRGICEPERAYPSLKELEKALNEKELIAGGN